MCSTAEKVQVAEAGRAFEASNALPFGSYATSELYDRMRDSQPRGGGGGGGGAGAPFGGGDDEGDEGLDDLAVGAEGGARGGSSRCCVQ